jgi:hypothetical protein
MIFKIFQEGDFFESNPSATLIEEFLALSSDEMKYICLVYDYDSPFRNLVSDVRKFKVLERLPFKKTSSGKHDLKTLDMVYGNMPKYVEAARALHSLMFNEDQADILAYKRQKEEIRNFLTSTNKTAVEMKNVKSYIENQSLLDEKIREIEERIKVKEEKEFIKNEKEDVGTTSASLIEEMNETN